MNWDELTKKHIREWKEFERLKEDAWQSIITRNNLIREAFGNKFENMPEHEQMREVKEAKNWIDKWGNDGTEYELLSALQKAEKLEMLKSRKLSIEYRFKKNKSERENDIER
ncbi:MAG: hypothetical protein QM737_09960 [Ferruginibacter sp.]